MDNKENNKQQKPGMRHLNNLLKKVGEDLGRKPLETNSLNQADSRAEAGLKVADC